jgi:D-alanine-D-alanine ligase
LFLLPTQVIQRTEEDLFEAIQIIRNIFHISGPILIQEFLEGADLNTGLIGNPPHHVFLPVTEEDFSTVPKELPRMLGFEAKWDECSPYYRVGTVPAKSIDEETKAHMNECSAKLFKRIGLRDYARFDWKLDKNGRPKLLEANANCGWAYDCHLQRMCALTGISYSQMLKMIIEAAQLVRIFPSFAQFRIKFLIRG